MRVIVPSLAKLNLDLRVLHKRADGFHELRTIFQTISLRDQLEIEFEPAKRTRIDLVSSIEISDNLVLRAARLLLERLKVRATVRLALRKRIPMGAGLGGGSSNAAAVLIALPHLAGARLRPAELLELAASLGSDVPYFLRGGTALGLGRGTELYPLPDLPPHWAVVVASGVHVSTPEAYRALRREVTDALTSKSESPILGEFQTIAWGLSSSEASGSDLDQLPLKNDFEVPVFGMHRELSAAVRRLRKLGARTARLTGSGSAVFGIFPGRVEARTAVAGFPSGSAFAVQFVTRRQYRRLWSRALGPISLR